MMTTRYIVARGLFAQSLTTILSRTLLCCFCAGVAARAPAQQVIPIEPISITDSRYADLRLEIEVRTALHDHPTIFDGHITVTVRDGVVTLSGVVLEDWDAWVARRIAAKIPGVKRVENDLDTVGDFDN